ncbi:MAG: hypothetical protein HZB32_05185, partial [Nitrospirae bacterium]|nr:hypothetical protein [Nitrospirota bacterium]
MNVPILNKCLSRKIGVIAWAVCVSLVITSCGSGSGTTETGVDQAGFSHDVPSCSSPPPNSVYLCRNEGKSTGDLIAVDVRLNADSPVFGAAFDMTLDPSVVKVARKEDQSIDFSPPDSPQEGPPVWKYLFVTLKEGQEDTLIVGASRGRGIEALTGSIPLVTLKFKTPSGKTPLSFSNNSLINPAGQPMELFKDQWYG